MEVICAIYKWHVGGEPGNSILKTMSRTDDDKPIQFTAERGANHEDKR